MTKSQTIPAEGGSFLVDPKTGAVTRQGGTKMPDQAAERAAERVTELAEQRPSTEEAR